MNLPPRLGQSRSEYSEADQYKFGTFGCLILGGVGVLTFLSRLPVPKKGKRVHRSTRFCQKIVLKFKQKQVFRMMRKIIIYQKNTYCVYNTLMYHGCLYITPSNSFFQSTIFILYKTYIIFTSVKWEVLRFVDLSKRSNSHFHVYYQFLLLSHCFNSSNGMMY